MKILHLLYESEGDYFGIGGVGVRAYEIYGHLKGRHDITLLCKKYLGAKDGEIEGLRHMFVGTESKSLTKTLLSYAYHAAFFVKRQGDEFDIIIEEFSPTIPTFLNLYKKRPVVLQIQGYTGKEYFEKYNIFYSTTLYIFERLRPKYYKDIIVVSEATKKRFNLNKKHNIQVISNGISEELFNLETDESDYILYLGRIDIHSKGLDILISAYREFHKSFPKIRLVIAGDGRDIDEFNTMLIDLPENVRRKIELSGWVSGEEKTEIISKALFVVFPSRHDVQSIALLEAMACGKAIVVSNIPEFNYVTDCRAGISFKTGDAASLAQCMKDLVTSDERKEMGKNGRERVRDYTWGKIALKYEEFLLSVCNLN